MSKSPSLCIVCLFVFWISLLFNEGAIEAKLLIPKEKCDQAGGVEVRYNEFYELYLGHDPNSDKLTKHGIVYLSLSAAVNACCPGMELNFTLIANKSVETLVQDDILHHHHDEVNETHLVFYFPEFTEQGQLEIYSHRIPFLKLRKSPGFALVMLKSDSHLDISASDIINPSWPIFALVLSLSWAVGILAWALDHFFNPEEFPSPFFRGMFDGFWWAIVTMTTVGYGDKSPKFILARILAVIWILTGAVLLSLFTANTTSIITESRLDKNSQTMGKKIGVVNMVDFVQTELNLGAQLIQFPKVDLALSALNKKTVDRLLFPHYLDLLYLMSEGSNDDLLKGLYIAKVYDKPFQIGMVLSHSEASDVKNEQFYTCLEIMTSQFSKQYQYDYSLIDKSLAYADGSTFDTGVTVQYLYGILSIILFMVILGLIFDAVVYCRNRSKQPINSNRTPSSGVV